MPAISVEIADPIQRAGMRLLSAAAVPIQTEIRRYLAKREAEDRLWAIIVIQSYFRRWSAELLMYKYFYCATKIQAAFRGWLVRDTIKHKHYCATQIQRVCRGYLATMKVYEALYNVTVVQSIARRNAAMKVAEKRLDSIVIIQSTYRGYACRKECKRKHKYATVIQAAWRCFNARLNYQFDIVDIIIVQSIARMRACQKSYASILHKRHTKAATVIQKYWRSYDCTMNYLHSIADILIVQSVVRRWIAMRYVIRYRAQRDYEMATRIQTAMRAWVARKKWNQWKSAIVIQKTWRGFKQYIEYIFTVADIIFLQKIMRGWLARRHFERLKILRREEKIYNAAVSIQKVWRGYQAHMNMLFTLVHIIIVQSVIRRRIAIVKFKPMLMEYRAALTIQCAWRMKSAKQIYSRESAARKIQAAVRGWFVYSLYKQFIAARRIQSWYRCQATRRGYLYYISARKIQTAWRGYDARKLAEEERWVREYAATMVQKNWRMYTQKAKFKKYVLDRNAATLIQSQWRCFWEYSHFVILRYEVMRIQAAFRGYQTRKRFEKTHEAATVIQTAARVMLARKFCHMERLFTTVFYSAQLSLIYKNAAKKIEKGYRDFHYSMKEKKAALIIERFFIWVRNEVEKEIERREKMKRLKRQKQRTKKTTKVDRMLNNIWDDTLEEASKPERMSVTNELEHSSYIRELSPKRTSSKVSGKFAGKVKHVSPTKSRVNVPNRSSAQSLVNGKNQSPAPSSPLVAKKIVHDLDNKPRPTESNHSALAALHIDGDDDSSEVSGLTTPSLTPRYLKHRKKSMSSLDEELNAAWAETKRIVLEKRANKAIKEVDESKIENENSSKENSASPPKSRTGDANSPTLIRRYQQNASMMRSPTKSQSSDLHSEMLRITREHSREVGDNL